VSDARIRITKDGPYVVRGDVPLVRVEIVTNDAGESVAWREIEQLGSADGTRLCRCGRSATKPYCDNAHLDGFDGTETASRDPFLEQAAEIEGPNILLQDARQLCSEARFCDRAGGLWNLVQQCDDPEVLALAQEEAALCPSGRYVSCDPLTGEYNEPEYEPSIALVEDPSLGVSGPLWVRGGIPVIGADGHEYEVRNRVTLCRCGHSKNKPFCDGSHIAAEFDDTE